MKIPAFFLVFLVFACTSYSDQETFLQEVLSLDLSADEKARLITNEMTYDEKVSFIRGSEWKVQGEVERLGLPPVHFQDSTMGVSFDGTSFPSTLVDLESIFTACQTADATLNTWAKIPT